MMNNLFSTFDPYSVSFYMYFLICFAASAWLILLWQNSWENTYSNWLSSNSCFKGFNWIAGYSSVACDSIKAFKARITTQSVSMCIFSSVLLLNMMGLFPYVFSPTSMTLFILLISGLYFFISLTFFMTNNKFYHLIPSGSPFVLSGVLFLIELVSLMIRPLTLGLRLSANITSGHILLHLVNSSISTTFGAAVFPSIVLNILEIAVGAIQAYVFMSLLTLYVTESSA
uniref:ATP synthase subunit a n=1 Tax=Gordionus wolterstorffii TaxID=190562 RepID=A0A514ABY0_9BILA|nr:ATP synthase F0 subunit 6 [Gordionus wolterstorffii]